MTEDNKIPLLIERVGLIERDTRDHAKSLTVITNEISHLAAWKSGLDVMLAREEERDKAITRRLDSIETSIQRNSSEWSKLQWIVIGSVVAAAAAFVFKGGLVL